MIDQTADHYAGVAPERNDTSTSAPWQFAEWTAGAIFQPTRTLLSVSERRAVAHAIVLVILLVLVNTSGQVASMLGRAVASIRSGASLFDGPAGVLFAAELSSVIWNIVWFPALWLITAGVLFGIGYLLGGRGSFMGFWAASGFALTPQLLIAPLSPALEAAGALGSGWQILTVLVSIPISIATFIWTLALLAVALQQSLMLSGTRSVAAVLILVVGLALLVALLILMFIIGFVAVVATLS
jgi:hypothetical protein